MSKPETEEGAQRRRAKVDAAQRRRVLVDVIGEVREVEERTDTSESRTAFFLFKLARALVYLVDEAGAYDVAALAQAADTWLDEAAKRGRKDRGLLFQYNADRARIDANDNRLASLGRLRLLVRDVLRIAGHEARWQEINGAAKYDGFPTVKKQVPVRVPYLVAPDGSKLRLSEEMYRALAPNVTDQGWHMDFDMELVDDFGPDTSWHYEGCPRKDGGMGRCCCGDSR